MFAIIPLTNANHKDWEIDCLSVRAEKILWPFDFSIYHSPTYDHNHLHFSSLESNSISQGQKKKQKKKKKKKTTITTTTTKKHQKNLNMFCNQVPDLVFHDLYVV